MKNIKRLLIVLETLSKEDEVRYEDLKLRIEQEIGSFDKSNLSRDIKKLKDLGFTFLNKKGIYRLIEFNDDDNNNNNIFRFLKLYVEADLFKEISHSKSNNRDFIITHEFSKDIDYETLTKILKAISDSKELLITHKGYKKTSHEKTYTLQPYFIREFKSRWYVIGFVNDHLRVFSVDRIINVTTTNTIFKPSIHKKNDLIDIISNTYGVSYSLEAKLETIKLKFDISQLRYLKSVPFYENQKIIEENTTNFILELFSYDTYELRQEILKYGSNVEVLEPLLLRNWVKSEISKIAQAYK
jgi:predicted DNA-binding transcriptional regulator YafY